MKFQVATLQYKSGISQRCYNFNNSFRLLHYRSIQMNITKLSFSTEISITIIYIIITIEILCFVLVLFTLFNGKSHKTMDYFIRKKNVIALLQKLDVLVNILSNCQNIIFEALFYIFREFANFMYNNLNFELVHVEYKSRSLTTLIRNGS